jgi:hypothetical protein
VIASGRITFGDIQATLVTYEISTMHFLSRRQFLRLGLANATILAAGCGTILHPERRGQPAGPLDWKIVVLDAIGLFLFFIPGVIAFAVDFSNGTIYLPADYYGLKGSGRKQKLITVSVPDERLTVPKVERIVSEHTQQEIRLQPGYYETEKLENIDDFWMTTDKLAAG